MEQTGGGMNTQSDFSDRNDNDVPNELLGIIPGYISRRIDDVREMRQHLDGRNFIELEILIHKIKGNSASFGLYRIHNLAVKLQEAMLSRHVPTIDDLISALEKELVSIKEAYLR